MKTRYTNRVAAFNRIELIVVLACIAVLVFAVLAALKKYQRRGSYVDSVHYLKQISLSVRLWSSDHGGLPPSQISTNQGGAMELVARGSLARYFQVMSNELGSVGIVRYMMDKERKPATNWAELKDDTISFFIVPEANQTIPQLWLAGDRHLATNHVPLRPGLFTMPPNPVMSWSADLDARDQSLCYADGHVEKPTSGRLQESAVEALSAYQKATTNTSFRIAIP